MPTGQLTRVIETRRRPGQRGKTEIRLTKEPKSTKMVVLSKEKGGNQRQITLTLDVRARRQLLERLLDHHEQDVG